MCAENVKLGDIVFGISSYSEPQDEISGDEDDEHNDEVIILSIKHTYHHVKML